MGILTFEERAVEYQWASDISFDGVRLEVLSSGGNVIFEVSEPDEGPITGQHFRQRRRRKPVNGSDRGCTASAIVNPPLKRAGH